MKKELLISAKFDTSDFDKSVETMQKKLKDIYAPADQIRMQQQTAQRLQGMGMGAAMSSPGQEAFKRSSMQERRELDRAIADEARGQEKLGKVIAKRLEILKELQTKQKETIKGSQEELTIKEKIARVEENTAKMRETYKQRDQVLNQMMDLKEKNTPQGLERLMSAYKGGGVGGVATAAQRMIKASPGAFLGGVGGVIGGLGALTSAGAEMYRDVKGMPIRSDISMGNAVQGTLGKDVNNIYSRRTAFEQFFQPERQKAAGQALEMNRANQSADKWSLGGNLAAIGGGALSTATGVGTIGGIAAMGKGLYGLATDERQRALLMSKMGSSSGTERYNSLLAEEMSKNYQNSYEAQKNQNPFKVAAGQEYEQNFQRNLDAQRSMGIGNEQFYAKGGFLDKNIKGGFTNDQAVGMANSITGSGGSSRSAFDNALMGNQMQRNMDLTNSGQILGSISGGVGGAEGTRQATIKVLAEGMRLGLDDSKFAEENRRFTAAAAEVIGRSGAKTETDFERLSKTFGSFQTEQTNQGVAAGQGAYQRYQENSGSTTGPRGVMRAAAMMQDKDLSKLNTVDKQALMGFEENQLTENNMVVQRAAEVTGLSPKEIIEKMQGVNKTGQSRFAKADQLKEQIANETDPVKIESMRRELASYTKVENPDFNALQNNSFATGISGGKAQLLGPGAGDQGAIAKLNSGADATGRMEDNTIAAMAGDAGTVLKNFNDMRGGMDEAAKSAAAFTDSIREMNAALQQALENARNNKGSESLNHLQKIMDKYSNSGTQTQTGKPNK